MEIKIPKGHSLRVRSNGSLYIDRKSFYKSKEVRDTLINIIKNNK
jgi:hypothetical protein